jgi:hypothetical protein
MPALALSKKTFSLLNQVKGETPEKKIVSLVIGSAMLKLRECEEAIVQYESRYGMIFEQFKKSWKKGAIRGKNSHEVERDYMEWEGFEAEKRHWLETIRGLQ